MRAVGAAARRSSAWTTQPSTRQADARAAPRAVTRCALWLLLGACAAPPPDCTTPAVQRNLSAMVRERVLRTALDASSSWNDAATRGRIDMATSVIVEDARPTGGNVQAGKVLCRATIAIEGMGADLRSIVRSETTVSYWVATGDDGRFLVGLTYADLEAVAAAHSGATSAPGDRPSPR